MDRAREQFETAGAKLVLIGQATPRQAAHFRRRREIELPVLADETRRTYKIAGLKVGSFMDLLGPKVVAKGAMTTARTRMLQGKTVGNAAQLGGGMVIDRDGRVAFTHRAADASDNAPPEELLDAVRGLG